MTALHLSAVVLNSCVRSLVRVHPGVLELAWAMSLWTHRRRRRLLEFLGGCPVLPLRARRLPQDPSMRFLILLHVLVAQLLVELQANGGKAPERIDKPPWTSQAMPPTVASSRDSLRCPHNLIGMDSCLKDKQAQGAGTPES